MGSNQIQAPKIAHQQLLQQVFKEAAEMIALKREKATSEKHHWSHRRTLPFTLLQSLLLHLCGNQGIKIPKSLSKFLTTELQNHSELLQGQGEAWYSQEKGTQAIP